MQVDMIIRALVERSDLSYRQVAAELGRSSAWASTTASPGRSPQLATVADVADVCGCDIAILDRESGETVAVVDPPHRQSPSGDTGAEGGRAVG